MKIKLLACIAFLSLMSCSGGDDSAPVNTENPTPTEKKLKKISGYDMENGGNLISEQLFQNDLVKYVYVYNPDGSEYYHREYSYNNDGILVMLQTYEDNILTSRETITYDSQQRISNVLREFFSSGVTNVIHKDYVYNDDNTITNEVYDSQTSVTNTFYLNDAGLVIRSEADSEFDNNIYIEEREYNGNNEVLFRRKSLNKTTLEYTLQYEEAYSYDLATPVIGSYLNPHRFGEFKANLVLFYSFHQRYILNENYLTGRTSASENQTRSYEYDEEGYPVKLKVYRDDVLIIEDHIEYE